MSTDPSFRTAHTAELFAPAAPAPGVPGKSTLTSRLGGPSLVLRVADPATARALGDALRGVHVQRDALDDRDDNGVAAGAEHAVEQARTSAGAPLRADVRERFEASLGADLSAVRVHTGVASASASAAVGARAYTVGTDIHFGSGQYQPDDPFGMHLLAHEVAHTVQQAGGAPRRQHKLTVSAPGDAAEVEADRAADAMVAGAHAAVGGAAPSLARAEAQTEQANTAGTSSKFGGSISTKSAKVNFDQSLTLPKIPLGKVDLELSAKLGGAASVEWSQAPDSAGVSVGGNGQGNDGGASINIATYAADAAKLLRDKAEGKEGWAVASEGFTLDLPKLGFTDAKDPETDQTKQLTCGATYKVTFVNGVTASTGLSFGCSRSGDGTVKSVHQARAGFTRSLLPPGGSIDMGHGVKLKGSCDLSGDVAIKPKWSEIFKETGKQLAESAGKDAAKGVESGGGAKAVLDAATNAEVLGFAAIAVSMTAALVIGASAIEEAKDLTAKGESYIQSYTAGGVAAMCGGGGGASNPAAFNKGMNDYIGATHAIAAKVMQRPDVIEQGIGKGEVITALRQACAGKPAAIYGKIEAKIRPAVAQALAQQIYRENSDDVWEFKSDARRDANSVAQSLDKGHDAHVTDEE